MDPEATWERFLADLEDGEFLDAYYALQDLKGWLVRGGFKPDRVPTIKGIDRLVEWAFPKELIHE